MEEEGIDDKADDRENPEKQRMSRVMAQYPRIELRTIPS